MLEMLEEMLDTQFVSWFGPWLGLGGLGKALEHSVSYAKG